MNREFLLLLSSLSSSSSSSWSSWSPTSYSKAVVAKQVALRGAKEREYVNLDYWTSKLHEKHYISNDVIMLSKRQIFLPTFSLCDANKRTHFCTLAHKSRIEKLSRIWAREEENKGKRFCKQRELCRAEVVSSLELERITLARKKRNLLYQALFNLTHFCLSTATFSTSLSLSLSFSSFLSISRGKIFRDDIELF